MLIGEVWQTNMSLDALMDPRERHNMKDWQAHMFQLAGTGQGEEGGYTTGGLKGLT